MVQKKPAEQRPMPQPVQRKQERSPPKNAPNYDDDDRPINVKNTNPYENAEDDGPQQP